MVEIENHSKIRILVVDDKPDTLEFLSNNLKNGNFEVYTACSGKMGIKKALEIMPHLIILDIMMSNIDGIDVCRYLRRYPNFDNVIIVFLSAINEDDTIIAGFNAGGDDYIVKPIKPKVLVSKVKALLRRSPFIREDYVDEIRFKNIIISKETYTVQYEDKLIALPRKEFELLYLLASKPNRVFKRNAIYDAIWGGDVIVGTRTIDVHIRRLRLHTGIDNIKTIKGVGYKFEERNECI
jgi:two-component system alkaline phosphatase synthesis response regulator PhoP